MAKASSLKSRIIVIALGIALGYLAKSLIPVTEDSRPSTPPSELSAARIDWGC